MRDYPDYVIRILKEEAKRIDMSFARIWGAMSPSPERDEIIWHLSTAKHKLNKLMEEQNNGTIRPND